MIFSFRPDVMLTVFSGDFKKMNCRLNYLALFGKPEATLTEIITKNDQDFNLKFPGFQKFHEMYLEPSLSSVVKEKKIQKKMFISK